MGDTYSIAWRTVDAQFWGVAQRRKRIYLVADFGGNTAPKILFEREGLSGDFKESIETWQGTARNSKTGFDKTSNDCIRCYDIGDRRSVANESIDVSPTLTRKMGTGGNNVPALVLENHPQDSRVTIKEDGIVPTLTGRMGTGGGNVPLTMQIRCGCEGGGKGALIAENISATLSCHNTQTLFDPIPIADKATRYKGGGDTRNNDGSANGLGIGKPGDPSNTLTASDRHAVAYALDRACFNQGQNALYDISIQEELAQTIVAKGPGGVSHAIPKTAGTLTAKMAKGTGGPAGDECQNLVAVAPEYIVRRLTPLECCRLQGFPDDWTDGLEIKKPTKEQLDWWVCVFEEYWELVSKADGVKKPKTRKQVETWLKNPYSDSALYKMWGNGIAEPNAMYVMQGIIEVLYAEFQREGGTT
jgi:DNA (cytosine-5)-methyltransferase 1